MGTVRLRARTREEANGWYSSITEAIHDIVGDVEERAIVTERLEPPEQLQEARRDIEPVTADAAIRNTSIVQDSLSARIVHESPPANVATVDVSTDAVQTT